MNTKVQRREEPGELSCLFNLLPDEIVSEILIKHFPPTFSHFVRKSCVCHRFRDNSLKQRVIHDFPLPFSCPPSREDEYFVFLEHLLPLLPELEEISFSEGVLFSKTCRTVIC